MNDLLITIGANTTTILVFDDDIEIVFKAVFDSTDKKWHTGAHRQDPEWREMPTAQVRESLLALTQEPYRVRVHKLYKNTIKAKCFPGRKGLELKFTNYELWLLQAACWCYSARLDSRIGNMTTKIEELSEESLADLELWQAEKDALPNLITRLVLAREKLTPPSQEAPEAVQL